MTRADLDKRPGDVAAMFDGVAKRYDLLNDVLSLGLDRRWRRVVAASIGARAGERVLDLAAGTGTSSAILARDGASCVACDFSLGMLKVGAARFRGSGRETTSRDGRPAVSFVAGDALALPFGDGVFDAVTISFGLRNVADAEAALAEMRRVTRPGGRLLICEFSHLASPSLDAAFDRCLAASLPMVARTLSRSPDAYSYLAESIRAWPDARELAGVIGAAGWSRVRWRTLSFGVVALHMAVNDDGRG
jgi:demethylmenaquinone methyltransferase / 2-methoxy-6-polyprenyl-1,4-benzoquinol methylase